jgi:hypothetical protein
MDIYFALYMIYRRLKREDEIKCKRVTGRRFGFTDICRGGLVVTMQVGCAKYGSRRNAVTLHVMTADLVVDGRLFVCQSESEMDGWGFGCGMVVGWIGWFDGSERVDGGGYGNRGRS